MGERDEKKEKANTFILLPLLLSRSILSLLLPSLPKGAVGEEEERERRRADREMEGKEEEEEDRVV